MEVSDLMRIIKDRRSIRAFRSESISDEQMGILIDALIWAPSAGNLQSRTFYFILNRTIKNKLVGTAWGQSFVGEAPLTVVACANRNINQYYGVRGIDPYMIMDVSASVQNLLLVAHALGLGACWVSAFNENAVTEILNLPQYLRPIALVPIGYADEDPIAPRRVSVEEAVKVIR
jgi:nitroreductase